MEEWKYSSTDLNLGIKWRWVVSFHAPAILLPGKQPRNTYYIGNFGGH
jgi:hypothetical protein